MKINTFYIFIFAVLFSTKLFATEFCNGWGNGYKTGYKKTATHNNRIPVPPFMGCPRDSLIRDRSEPASAYERGYIAGLQEGMVKGLKAREEFDKNSHLYLQPVYLEDIFPNY
jgi:hypothetical protein